MLLRLLTRVLTAVALLALVWRVGSMGGTGADSWIRPVGGPRGPVRILQFYATTGMLMAGQKAKLCYGVENARAVHISPRLVGGVGVFAGAVSTAPASARVGVLVPQVIPKQRRMVSVTHNQCRQKSFGCCLRLRI